MSSFKCGPEAKVTAYTPFAIDSDKSEKAQKYDFVDQQEKYAGDGFEINASVSTSIGRTDAKTKEQQKRFDGEVLKYVQKIKDNAFKEAYEKGLNDGAVAAREQAYAEAKKEIEAKVETVIAVAKGLTVIREEMYEINEKEIVNFCYFLAEKVIFKEIEKKPELIAEAIKKVTSQKEEITVKLSPADYDFMQAYTEKLAVDMNISKIRFEKDDGLVRGDVSLESAQGTVDATLATRLKKLKLLLDGLE